MKCPHCGVEILPSFVQHFLGSDNLNWSAYSMCCPNPECHRIIIDLGCAENINFSGNKTCLVGEKKRTRVYPVTTERNFKKQCIDDRFWNDYEEACKTLAVSPKASAALSRRCLQNILREKGGIKKGNLSDEIQQIIDKRNLPSLLADSIDAVRIVGNFAAHPTKDKSTGEIVEVETGEAEWLLDVLEDVMDFYFIQPQKFAERKEALNQKLQAMGKPLMK